MARRVCGRCAIATFVFVLALGARAQGCGVDAGRADSLLTVLVDNFMDKRSGIFWATPHDENCDSNIYWQQAHAIDVVAYAYERKQATNRKGARLLRRYMEQWYAHRANNYHHDASDSTGFANPFTDDMAWIGLSLVRLSEALGDAKYADMARLLYDRHIITRAKRMPDGLCLPWTSERLPDGRLKYPNGGACTHAPACLLAVKLHSRYGDRRYLDESKALYGFMAKAICKADGRCEEPPLSYTQGTFGEACRLLFHATGDDRYGDDAARYLLYAIRSERCCRNGLLRHEGESVDQSIFKAVLVPYLVNFVLDAEISTAEQKAEITTFLRRNADVLWQNLDKEAYPRMFCPYYWGDRHDASKPASMGAMVSGASLMEGVCRLLRL